ncbi:cytochrome P450, partial [Mycena rosella]
MSSLYIPAAIFCLASAAIYSLYSRYNRSHLRLPPGPRKLPLVGNLFDVPPTFQWERYKQWSQQYNSDVIHLSLAGKSVIVLSSLEAAEDLLEKRSSIYSDRTDFPMVVDLMGWDFNIGDEWRASRRLVNHALNAKASRQFRPQELAASRALLPHLLHSPDQFVAHFRHMAAQVIMAITYGITVRPADDPYIILAEKAAESFSLAAVPGLYLVDTFPLLKYVPAWMPGAGFKRQAAVGRALARAALETPFTETKQQMGAGVAPGSFTSDALHAMKDCDALYYQERHIKAAAGSMFTAGADTTPDAQRKAQAEIDSVTGRKHLPDFGDEASLPYVSALVKEVLRWKNITPSGLPHRLITDDEYPVKDPEAAFGFGRRICPGRHLVRSFVWITVASILATFNIEKAVDDTGHAIEPSGEYSSELVSSPLPFKCSIVPRSEDAVALIRSM